MLSPILTTFFLVATMASLATAIPLPTATSTSSDSSPDLVDQATTLTVKAWILKNFTAVAITIAAVTALLLVGIAICVHRCMSKRRQKKQNKNNAQAAAEAGQLGHGIEMIDRAYRRREPAAINPDGTEAHLPDGDWAAGPPAGPNPDGGKKEGAGKFGFRTFGERAAGMLGTELKPGVPFRSGEHVYK